MNTKKFFINFVIIIMAVFLIMANVNALNVDSCATAEISDISPSSVGVNEEFTVGVQIENCGSVLPENITFQIINPPNDIIIKEPLIMQISRFWGVDSDRFIKYHMKTKSDAKPGIHNIKTRLLYGGKDGWKTEYGNITINLIGDEAELSIASIKTSPALPRKGEMVELTLRIENTGDGTAKSVRVYMNHSFQGLKQSFIGALDSGEDGPAILTFIVNKRGEFEFPVTISYKDDFGANEIKTNINLNVLKKKSNIGVIILVIIIIGVFSWGIYHFTKTKKAKDKIIHQLLSGETKEKTEEIKTTKRHHKKHREEREKREKRKREFKREILAKYKK